LTTVLIIVFAAYFLLYCLKVKNPDHAVYVYLIVWTIFPKYVRLSEFNDFSSHWTAGLYIFDFVNAITAFGLLIVCLSRPKSSNSRHSRIVNGILIAFVGMTITSIVSGVFLSWDHSANFDIVEYYVRPTLSMIYGAIFGWACQRYIDSLRKIERLLGCIVFSGIELTVEVILFYYGGLLPELRRHIVNVSGRFLSISYLSFDAVGVVIIISVCSTLYFAITRKSVLLGMLALFMLLPAISSAERAPLSGALLGMCAIVFFCAPRRYSRVLGPLGVGIMGIGLWYAAINLGDLPTRLNAFFGGVTSPNNTLTETFYARVGLWLRGLDIFIHYFPWGVGNNLVAYHMSLQIPAHFNDTLEGLPYAYYRNVVENVHITNTHNAFLEFVIENGLLGMLVLGSWCIVIATKFRRFWNQRGKNVESREYVAQACIYAGIIGMTWRYMFEASDKLYFWLFFTMVALNLLPRLLAPKLPLRCKLGTSGSPVSDVGDD
jgi:hypothetical protein